jgi:hypothetical protein
LLLVHGPPEIDQLGKDEKSAILERVVFPETDVMVKKQDGGRVKEDTAVIRAEAVKFGTSDL